MKKLILAAAISVLTLPTAYAEDMMDLEAQGFEEPDFEVEEPVESLVVAELNAQKFSVADLFRWTEYRYGHRLESSDLNDDTVMNELRTQMGWQHLGDKIDTTIRGDLLLDAQLDEAIVHFRELNVSTTSTGSFDATLGRQMINWSIPDILYLNDLFPKDYAAFFIGRDAEGEYMIHPSDSLQLNWFAGNTSVDFVYSPHFTPYVTPGGERLSYYDPMTQSLKGEDDQMPVEDKWEIFDKDAVYLRILTMIKSHELFFFAHDGYWPVPNAIDPVEGEFYYAPLRTYGAAYRGPLMSGILSLEASYYDSLDDEKGDDPMIPNTQVRTLVRYDFEVMKDLNATAQYYTEIRQDQDAYESTAMPGMSLDQVYELYTLRLTRMLLKQTLTLSFMGFYSPTDEDHYLRANVYYQPDDRWMFHVGVNRFDGKSISGRWAGYEENSNAFAAVRYYW